MSLKMGKEGQKNSSTYLVALLSHGTTKYSPGDSPLNTCDHAGIYVVGPGNEWQRSVSQQDIWLVGVM